MVKKLYNAYFKHSDFGRNVSKLAGGTLLSQVIAILATPIYSRLFLPEDFGFLGVFLSISTIIASLSVGKYYVAIVLPKEETVANNLIRLSILYLLLFVLLLTVLACVSFKYELLRKITNFEFGWCIFFIPVHIFTVGMINILKFFNNRNGKFGIIAIGNIFNSASKVFVNLLLGIFNVSSGLLFGVIISNIVSLGVLLFSSMKKLNFLLLHVSVKELISTARDYYRFPKYDMTSELFNVATKEMPLLLIAAFYSDQIVGHYSMANRILLIPVSLVTASIGSVFYKQCANLNRTETFDLTKRIVVRLFCLSIVPFIVLFFWGPEIFSFVLGDQWEMAGIFAGLLGIQVIPRLIASTISPLVWIYNKQKFQLMFAICTLALNIILIYGCHSLHIDAKKLVLLLSLLGVIQQTYYLVKLIRIAKNSACYLDQNLL